MNPHRTETTGKRVLFLAGGLGLIGALAYTSLSYYSTDKRLKVAQHELGIVNESFQTKIESLEAELEMVRNENEDITEFLDSEQKKNLELEQERRKNERKINNLEKLTTIDPELLKKYSKVYFLSENYNPPKLADIDRQYVINPDRGLQILAEVEPFLQNMLEVAEEDGVDIRVISAYRSFQTQMQLKSNYTVTYGSGANTFSADQGYSEHQLGTTLDFGTPEVTGAFLSFEKTDAFEWLVEHAWKYGFVMSYPKGNSYYTYEPWHWRFVGVDLATILHNDGKYFYELDQREIDKHIIGIFD